LEFCPLLSTDCWKAISSQSIDVALEFCPLLYTDFCEAVGSSCEEQLLALKSHFSYHAMSL